MFNGKRSCNTLFGEYLQEKAAFAEVGEMVPCDSFGKVMSRSVVGLKTETISTCNGKRPQRPCKGRRIRYQKLVLRLKEAIEKDPESFDFEALVLPPSISRNLILKDKLRKHTQDHMNIVRKDRGNVIATCSSSRYL
mmetsp:Transcript_104558/g.191674  ORF Transcript_104558/g.191674 Transcript_104558/m.191674 type:complete len:137 (+) Transcript_104558:37-447(+)